MSIIAATIINAKGQPIMSRQFLPISTRKIESIISHFTKLIKYNPNQSFVEKGDVRYIYRVMDSIYLLLITKISSNFLADSQTLNLMSRMVFELCDAQTEECIEKNSFELIFMLDEIVYCGERQCLDSIEKIKKCVEMESKTEEDQSYLRKLKEKDAKLLADRKAEDFRKGIETPKEFVRETPKTIPVLKVEISQQKPIEKKPVKVQKEVKKIDKDSLIKKMFDFESGKKAFLVCFEEIKAEFDRDCTLKNLAINGTLGILTKENKNYEIELEAVSSEYKVQLHPKFDMGKFKNKNLVCFKNDSAFFAKGLAKTFSILKYSLHQKNRSNESFSPLMLSVWSSEEEKSNSSVTVEAVNQSNLVLSDLVISLRTFGIGVIPKFNASEGKAESDEIDGKLIWKIPNLIESESHCLEFEVEGEFDSETLFPLTASFRSEGSMIDFKVKTVREKESSEEIGFEFKQHCSASEFVLK